MTIDYWIKLIYIESVQEEKRFLKSLLVGTGITINGDKPHDPQVHNEKFYKRVLNEGSVGLGEAYMDGWWDCARLDQFFYKILSANVDKRVKLSLGVIFNLAWNYLLNPGRKSKAFKIGERHYDIGNDLYRAMLDKRLTYTGGYWSKAKNLDEAQEAKLDLVCKKIGLKRGQSVLDIGSGWGSFIRYANEKYGARAIGVTVAKEQKKLADKLRKSPLVKTLLRDYRDVKGKYDHIVSLGMFEHVGVKNYRIFMELVHKTLKKGGLFLLQTIGANISGRVTDPWFDKYIFPGGKLPSARQIAQATEGLFVMEDWHNFGADYDKTLMEWYKNFKKNWGKIKSNYDERFYRMWKYYLLVFAGSFRARRNQLWQIVFSKEGVAGGYKTVR